jgi:hypothetical protein
MSWFFCKAETAGVLNLVKIKSKSCKTIKLNSLLVSHTDDMWFHADPKNDSQSRETEC